MLTPEQHSLSLELRGQVYMDPCQFDRPLIRALLEKIQHAHPEHIQAIIQGAFERVVENASDDQGTAMIELFLGYGASVDCALLFHKATQCLDIKKSPSLPQVRAVLHCLIQAGSDPHARWMDELGGYTTLEAMRASWVEGGYSGSSPAQQLIEEVLVWWQLEANTAPALAPSHRSGRL